MYLVVIPLSSAASVIPLPMGPLEWTLDTLYTLVPATATIAKGQGFVVALAYRLLSVLNAAFGIPYYLGNRREVAAVIHEVEAEERGLELGDGEPQA